MTPCKIATLTPILVTPILAAPYWTYANNFTYNAAGAVTSMELGNLNWEKAVFNSRLQPTEIALGKTSSATDLLKLDFDYGSTANNGNVQSQTITAPSVGSNVGFVAVQSYNYDSLNRLKDATENVTPTGGSAAQSWKQTFTFDRYGNRNFDESHTTMPSSFSNPAVSDPTVSSSTNRLTSSGYSYDSAGNTTADAGSRTFTYDGENKQVAVSDGSGTIGQYFYDGDGKRVRKIGIAPGTTSNEELTIFVYDAGGKQIAEYSTVVANSTDAKVNYLTADHLGSPRINTDRDGTILARHDYQPFGEEIASTERTTHLGYPTNGDRERKQFTGYERDKETALDFAQARMYSSTFGRFMSVDPLVASATPTNPQTFNRFSYVDNNPTNTVNSTGMAPGDYYDQNGDWIGADILDDGKNYLVTNNNEVRDIQSATRNHMFVTLPSDYTSLLTLPEQVGVLQSLGVW